MRAFLEAVKEVWQEEPLLFTFFTLCLLGAIILLVDKPSRWPFFVVGIVGGHIIALLRR